MSTQCHVVYLTKIHFSIHENSDTFQEMYLCSFAYWHIPLKIMPSDMFKTFYHPLQTKMKAFLTMVNSNEYSRSITEQTFWINGIDLIHCNQL